MGFSVQESQPSGVNSRLQHNPSTLLTEVFHLTDIGVGSAGRKGWKNEQALNQRGRHSRGHFRQEMGGAQRRASMGEGERWEGH